MKIVLMSILTLSTMAQARNLELTCKFAYDIDDKFEMEIESNNIPGEVSFSESKDNLVTYYIPKERGAAIWHNEASMSLSAKVEEDNLIVNYKFNNYLRDESEVVNVYNETRNYKIDIPELDDGEIQYFDLSDGEVVSSQVNKNDWINETGLKLDGCELVDLDLVTQEEEVVFKRPSRLTRFFRRVFN